MSKSRNRNSQQQHRRGKESHQLDLAPHISSEPKFEKAPPLEPKTRKQRDYINAIRHSTITFGLGPAGSGKTYIAASLACEMLLSKEIERIIITRPAVEADGEKMGFLPGELSEKYEPYIAPFRDVFHERLGRSTTDHFIKHGRIEAIPLGFMRGKTFKNCLVILDEAQNATAVQMKLFLTRIGENCKVVVDGDETQTDIPNSGLSDAVARITYIPTVKAIRFGREDIVRSGIVAEIIQAYDQKI